MDLAHMPEYNGFNCILRVDHLSKLGCVYPVRIWSANEVGDALICILSTSTMPHILQSEIGGEVGFECMFVEMNCNHLLTSTFFIQPPISF
jgi:hypothetical protein